MIIDFESFIKAKNLDKIIIMIKSLLFSKTEQKSELRYQKLLKYEPEQEPINSEGDIECLSPIMEYEEESLKSTPDPGTEKYESVGNVSNEVNVFSDLFDEELNVYNKPDIFPDAKPAESYLWGSTNDQAVWVMSTIYDTNIFNYSGSVYLIILRSAFFALIAWVVSEDIKQRHNLHLEKYTVWGELSTLIATFLLVLCSIQKYIRELYYNSQ